MTFSRRSLMYLGIAVAIFVAAVALGATKGIDPGWAFAVFPLLLVVMVGHDAYSRGLTPVWGVVALSLIGMFLYVREVRRRHSPPLA